VLTLTWASTTAIFLGGLYPQEKHNPQRDGEKMLKRLGSYSILGLVLVFAALPVWAQVGNSGSIDGVVKDPSGAVVAGAKVEISYSVSGYQRETSTESDGTFRFANVPFNSYHLVVTSPQFASYTQDVDVRSTVPTNIQIGLKLGTATTSVTVEANGGDLVENESTFHTDVDRNLFDKLPLESASSSVSSLVTLVTPGVAADSNGLFHGLGDHAENSFSVDGQPITDQQSKVFSNQIPSDSIQSLEVISGAPPAEFGGKTSLVIKVTTRSGLGVTTPHGSVSASYGAFGTSTAGFDLAYGNQKWGNFIALNGLNTGRFLDPPEFTVMHDKGNEENLFDRVDYQLSQNDAIHLNVGYSRSWFQTPNSFDQEFHPCDGGGLAALGYTCDATGTTLLNPMTGQPLGPADQRSKIGTFNIAPTWTRLIGSTAVFTFGGFVRKDQYNYYPSGDPLNDLSPDLQAETAIQNRELTNAGLRTDGSYVKGIHNIKAGITAEHTFLTENDGFGIVDPTFNNPASATFNPILAPYDLTRGGTLFNFHGHTDVKEVGMYVQDTISKGSWSFNLGIRGDLYRGISHATQAEPRLGIAYNIKPTNTVLRISYARTLESPFNENLVIASTGCSIPVIAAIVPPPGVPCTAGPVTPAFRNEFHAGLQQAFGKYLVVDGEYIWKYTHNGYDFGVVGATPITFPIEWQRNKIPGYAVRVSVPDYHGFTALMVMSGVAARFFLPQVAGLPIIGPGTSVFRIDHDELFNQTTHLQYQPWKRGPWIGFNWRYDSGLVSGAVPCQADTATCFASTSVLDGGGAAFIPGTNTPLPAGDVALVNAILGLPLTADQEFQAGLTCNGQLAAPNPRGPALASCPANELGSIYVKVPAPGTENDDHNPQRIQPRSLFDASVGHDNLFHGDRYKWSLRFTVINLANKTTLYNFLSTFSGTHYVTPRSETLELGFHF
jgi:Carboxypeptidase regulatory-like domain